MKTLSVLKSRFITHSPIILSHMITSLCNARCKMCNLWKETHKYTNDLSTKEIFKMLESAKAAGMFCYVVWGGEPLLRKDLPEILKFAKGKGFIITVITNGFLLKERAQEIAPFTDYLIVSIDANSSQHDRMRGVKGILNKAIDGIKEYKKMGGKVIINSVVTKLNLDKIGGLFKLAKELGVTITFEPIDAIPGYNESILATDKELKKVFLKIIKYKKKGYDIGNSVKYLRNFSERKQYTCHSPKIYVTVDANGNFISCLNKSSAFSKRWNMNIRKTSFKELFKRPEFKSYCKMAEKCSDCNVACVIETSIAYSLDPSFILEKILNKRIV